MVFPRMGRGVVRLFSERALGLGLLLALMVVGVGSTASAQEEDGESERPTAVRTQKKSRKRAVSADDSAADALPFNPLFGYPHLLPSPFTLPAGRMIFGTSIAYGITDFLQIGTDLLRDFYQVYNANVKVSLVSYPAFAGALTLGFETVNLSNLDSTYPDLWVTVWRPGAVTAVEVMHRTALFLGGNLYYLQEGAPTLQSKTAAILRGASVGADLAFSYNPRTRKNPVGNVLAAGISYDVTYALWGFGLSHHWQGFQLGFHYYPEAARNKVQPILVGGGVVQF